MGSTSVSLPRMSFPVFPPAYIPRRKPQGNERVGFRDRSPIGPDPPWRVFIFDIEGVESSYFLLGDCGGVGIGFFDQGLVVGYVSVCCAIRT